MQTVPHSEITARHAAFKAKLSKRGMAGALITSRVDRFYLSGTVQEGLLWVPAAGDAILWILRDPVRARRETPIEVRPVSGRRELWGALRSAMADGPAGVIGDSLALADARRLNLPLDVLVDVSSELSELRAVKSPWEAERMAEAGAVAVQVYAHAAEVLRPGMTEAELAGLLFAKAMALGHEGLLRTRGNFEAYSWHILSGPNAGLAGANDSPMGGEGMSPSFPVGAGRRPIQKGEPILVDFGICVFGYQTDQTRTFCIGPPPAWLEDAHRAIDEVHLAGLAALAPGVKAGQVFAAGQETARALGLEGYLGAEGSRCRFVGHGVGLETTESPVVSDGSGQLLEAGMTVALEPKAVVPGLGGLGVEDTFVLTPSGSRSLTPIPEGLLVV